MIIKKLNVKQKAKRANSRQVDYIVESPIKRMQQNNIINETNQFKENDESYDIYDDAQKISLAFERDIRRYPHYLEVL